MATDYDAPRKTDEELAEDSLEELKARRAEKTASAVDADEAELAENLELPGADLPAGGRAADGEGDLPDEPQARERAGLSIYLAAQIPI